MSYLSEFRLNWTNLLGAGLGLAFGSAFNHYMMNLFGPALIAEFGWSKAQFALIGAIGIVGMVCTPIAGRINDVLGPRTAAAIGLSVIPIGFLALSFMTGNIYQFYAIIAIKSAIGIIAATMAMTRVVVERFDKARGIALACLLSCPPLVGTIFAPIIAWMIEAEGWRNAYRFMALVSAMGGISAVLLIGKYVDAKGTLRAKAPKLDWAQFVEFCRNPTFVLLMFGMFLVNFPQPIVSSQMSIMLIENGATRAYAAAMLSVYTSTVIVGRFIGGYALDRVPPHVVAIVSLGLPAIGFAMLALPFDARWLMAVAMACVGLAQGAETDVAAVLTSRRFGLGHYSFVFSLLMTAMGLASSVGSVVLSLTLRGGGNFNLFLIICAVATIAGALCFFATGRFHRGEAAVAAR
ncbi:MAG: MFS transporter [Novosphingobium sp.]